MATERRPARPSTRIGPKPTTRVGAKPETRTAKQPTARTSRGVPSSKKNNTPLIIGGAVGGVILLIVIIAIAASGGSKKEEKKEDASSKKPSSSGPTGPKVDQALLTQGVGKCEQGLEMVQKLEDQIANFKAGRLSDADQKELRKKLEEAHHKLQDGMKDIETSNGKESVSKYTMAMRTAADVLKALK